MSLDILMESQKYSQNEKEIIGSISRNWKMIAFTNQKLRSDRDIALLAIKQDGMALMYLGDELRNDRELVLTAVKNNGMAFSFCSDKLKNDKEIVLIVIKKYNFSLEIVGEELKNDKEFLYEIKEFIEEERGKFPWEYDLLKRYERDDKLVDDLNGKEDSYKNKDQEKLIKKKI